MPLTFFVVENAKLHIGSLMLPVIVPEIYVCILGAGIARLSVGIGITIIWRHFFELSDNFDNVYRTFGYIDISSLSGHISVSGIVDSRQNHLGTLYI